MKNSVLFIILFIICLACKEEQAIKDELQNEPLLINSEGNCPPYILKEKENNLNISILLDLSDRIEEPKMREKDSAYLTILSKVFIEHIKHKKLILLEDRMQLFFNPEPSDEKINEIAKNLKVVFTKDTPETQIEKVLTIYAEKPSILYDLAKIDATTSGNYPGSDIWRFFKDNVRDYCIDKCHRNILVILTDGYMYHEKSKMKEKNRTSYLTPNSLDALYLNNANWKEKMEEKGLGFIPATSNITDLEVLVIGLNSQNDNNPYAQDIIENFWRNWFDEMGIKDYKIKNADIPTSMEKIIFDFINKT